MWLHIPHVVDTVQLAEDGVCTLRRIAGPDVLSGGPWRMSSSSMMGNASRINR